MTKPSPRHAAANGAPSKFVNCCDLKRGDFKPRGSVMLHMKRSNAAWEGPRNVRHDGVGNGKASELGARHARTQSGETGLVGHRRTRISLERFGGTLARRRRTLERTRRKAQSRRGS